jgi:hypothetical protein
MTILDHSFSTMYYSLTTQTCTAVRHGFRIQQTQQRFFTKGSKTLRSTTTTTTQKLDRMPTNEVASELAKAETKQTGTGPIAGGAAGMFLMD